MGRLFCLKSIYFRIDSSFVRSDLPIGSTFGGKRSDPSSFARMVKRGSVIVPQRLLPQLSRDNRSAKSQHASTLHVIDSSAQDLMIENQALAVQP